MHDYYYDFDDDTPGDIVEALNEDKSIILWDLDSSGSGVMIRIDYKGIHIKQVQNERTGINNGDRNIDRSY